MKIWAIIAAVIAVLSAGTWAVATASENERLSTEVSLLEQGQQSLVEAMALMDKEAQALRRDSEKRVQEVLATTRDLNAAQAKLRSLNHEPENQAFQTACLDREWPDSIADLFMQPAGTGADSPPATPGSSLPTSEQIRSIAAAIRNGENRPRYARPVAAGASLAASSSG